MVAWMGAVLDGLDPMVALEYHVLWGSRALSRGQDSGHRFRT